MQKSSSNKYVKNALIISVGGFISKLLGAFYRIPLTNMLGSDGIGIYQMVFPVYCILLDFAGAGLPCGLSKLISSNVGCGAEEKNLRLLKTALRLMFVMGLACSLVMLVFAKPIAALQGNASAFAAYAALAPSVFFVALLSCYRGYFQGNQNMLPTAISQIAEQGVKLSVGLFLVGFFAKTAADGAALATLAVSASEAFALAILFVIFKKAVKNARVNVKGEFFNFSKSIVKICLPVTLTGILLPVSGAIDSFLIINLISGYLDNATALYGLMSGGVASVIGLPVSLCYGFAVSALPAVSKNSAENASDDGVFNAIYLTTLLSSAMAAGCLCFPKLITQILFFGLKAEEKVITAKLLRLSAVSVIFASLMQTTNSVLLAKDKPYVPVIGLSVGIVVKILFEVILISNPKYNIYGAAFSLNLCYFVAVFVNLLYIIMAARRKDETKRLVKEEL